MGEVRECDGDSTGQARQSRWYWAIAAVGALLAAYLLYGIAYVPEAQGDEQDLLSNDYRYVTYGERGGQIIISENYNQRAKPKLPFPWVSWLRSLYHRVVGVSCCSARVFSAAVVFSCLVITAVVCPLRSGLSGKWVLLLLLAAGLSPPLCFAARSVRLEQEILLLGVLSVFVQPLFLGQSHRQYTNLALWYAAGVLSGWAAISHPGGCVFLLPQVWSLICYRKAWRETDGLGFAWRGAMWFLGVATAVGGMIACVSSDWSHWAEFLRDMDARFAAVQESLVEWWAPQWPFSIGSQPPLLAASLYAFGLSATSPFMSGYGPAWVLKILFAIEAVFVLVASVWYVLRPCRARELAFRNVLILAAGFIVFHFFYAYRASPNYTYYPYLGLLVPLGFAWIAVRLVGGGSVRRWSLGEVLRRVPLAVVGLGILLYAHFACHQIRSIHRELKAGRLISLDCRLDAVGQMGERLQWLEKRAPVYVDNLSWRSSGPRWKSLFELLLAEEVPLPEPADHVAFNARLLDSFFHYPGFGSKQLTGGQRLKRMAILLEGRELVGVLFDGTTEYYFYAPASDARDGKIVVGQILDEDHTVWNCTEQALRSPIRTPRGFRYEDVPRGTYLLWIRGEGLQNRQVHLSTGSKRARGASSETTLQLGSIHVSSAKAAIVEVREDASTVSLELDEGVQSDPQELSVSLARMRGSAE